MMRILATVAAGTLLFAVAACGTDEEAERERAEAEKRGQDCPCLLVRRRAGLKAPVRGLAGARRA